MLIVYGVRMEVLVKATRLVKDVTNSMVTRPPVTACLQKMASRCIAAGSFNRAHAETPAGNTAAACSSGISKLKGSLVLVASLVMIIGCVAKEDPAIAHGNQLGAIEYIVKTGDNLVLIASEITRQQENWRRIADFNRIDNPATLRVGQKIWIPRDLIPITNDKREVAGHPDAVVNSVQLPGRIKPDN